MTETLKNNTFLKTVLVDFDGVIHEYTSKWTDAATIADGPVPGALDFRQLLVGTKDFKTAIYSSRSKDFAGLHAMQMWLGARLAKAFGQEERDRIMAGLSFPIEKPAAWITIDDRAFLFEGTFPTLAFLRAFKPWNKKPAAALQIGDVPERMARYAAARGKTVDYLLEDPDVMQISQRALRGSNVETIVVDRLAGLASAAWELLDATEHAPDGSVHVDRDDWDRLSQAVTELRELLPPNDPIDGGAVVRELLQSLPNVPSSPSLDREFAPYAAVEAFIAAAVPPGTPVVRACAGGELGWRIGVGHGWMSVEGCDPWQPDVLRDFARKLAALPDPLAGKQRKSA